jgi:5-methylcytosine-specific restriction endonuclease McrA
MADRRAYQRQWEAANRDRLNAKSRARYAAHIDEERARHKARSEEYRERKRVKSKERYAARRAEFLEYHRQYRELNREIVRARKRAWMKANRGYASALCAKWNAAKLRACPSWVDWEALQAIYREAVRITRDTGIKHDVDHIVPLQSDTVCGLHVPWNLQILTRSENARKGNRLAA